MDSYTPELIFLLAFLIKLVIVINSQSFLPIHLLPAFLLMILYLLLNLCTHPKVNLHFVSTFIFFMRNFALAIIKLFVIGIPYDLISRNQLSTSNSIFFDKLVIFPLEEFFFLTFFFSIENILSLWHFQSRSVSTGILTFFE